MKTCPICKRQFPTKQALAAHRAAVHGMGRSMGGGRGQAQGGTSSLTFSRFEYIASQTSKGVPLQPGSTGARQLDNLAGIFEQYRWDALSFTFRPTVGAQTDGTCFVGISYESDHRPVDKASIAACSPSDSFPVSRERTLTVPVRQLMHSAWLPTKAASGEGKDSASIAGYLNLRSDKDVDVWIRYTITLSGPTSVSRVRDEIYAYNDSTRAWTKQEEGDIVAANTIDARDGPLDLDVELNTDDTTVVDRIVAQLRALYQDLTEVHRMTTRAATLVHMFATGALAARLPVLAVPALIHHRQLPFRPTLQFRQLCGNSGVGEPSSEPYRAVVGRGTSTGSKHVRNSEA